MHCTVQATYAKARAAEGRGEEEIDGRIRQFRLMYRYCTYGNHRQIQQIIVTDLSILLAFVVFDRQSACDPASRGLLSGIQTRFGRSFPNGEIAESPTFIVPASDKLTGSIKKFLST